MAEKVSPTDSNGDHRNSASENEGIPLLPPAGACATLDRSDSKPTDARQLDSQSAETNSAQNRSDNDGHDKSRSAETQSVRNQPSGGQSEKKQSEKNQTADNQSAVHLTAVHRTAEKEPSENEGARANTEPPNDDWVQDMNPSFLKRIMRLWSGFDGLAIMVFGVCIPALALLAVCEAMPKRMTLVLLNHPLETVAELLMLVLVPVVNFTLWSALRKNDGRFSFARGILAGSAIASSLVVATVAIAAGMNTSSNAAFATMEETFSVGLSWLAMLGLLAAGATTYIVYRFQQTRDFARSRKLIVGYTAAGAILSTAIFAGAEAKPWIVRNAERQAVSSKEAERAEGMKTLSYFFPERAMRMECTDPRAAGLCGLFLPLKKSAQQELYFSLTGKPFSFKDDSNPDLTAMPDDYLSRHAVGEPIVGLSLARSLMTCAVHPTTLSSSFAWTFVFKNDTNAEQDARAELGLPPGAVVTGLAKWVGSDKQSAVFAATGKAQQAGESWQHTGTGSATVSDLGQDRMLLHCYPIRPDEELKVEVRIVAPLKPDSPLNSSLLLPKLIASNFSLEDENSVKLYSPTSLRCGFPDLKEGMTNDGIKMLSGRLKAKQLQSAEILISSAISPASLQPIAALDELAVKIAQEDERKKNAELAAKRGVYYQPKELVLMVDARQGIREQIHSLGKALRERNAEKPKIKIVKPQYVLQSMKPIKSVAPKQLIVVVDGSDAMRGHVKAIKSALLKVPAQVPVSLMVASQSQPALNTPVPLNKGGLDLLDKAIFQGGQNNLKSVIDASDIAGASRGGAVLWIHGPQPVFNSEIYPTTPYYAHPAFYELPVDSGEIDTGEFFKNHSDIGPFVQVSHQSDLTQDIACFFSRWQPNSAEYTVNQTETTETPDKTVLLSENDAHELLQLHAAQTCAQLLSERKPRRAARIAAAYGIVTPVSCAVIDANARMQDNPEDDSNARGQDALATAGNTQVSGATNGTISPQGADATYVTGVNTTGTVRVNNLANLEALLNIIANGCELLFLSFGVITIVSAFFNRQKKNEWKMVKQIGMGVACAVIGLATPGVINWLVASARDANLFS